MFNNLHSLDLTSHEIELIEAALQTQKKILSVQSQAGGSGAHQKLSDLKHLMKRLNRSTQLPATRTPEVSVGWSQWIAAFLTPATRCDQPR